MARRAALWDLKGWFPPGPSVEVLRMAEVSSDCTPGFYGIVPAV